MSKPGGKETKNKLNDEGDDDITGSYAKSSAQPTRRKNDGIVRRRRRDTGSHTIDELSDEARARFQKQTLKKRSEIFESSDSDFQSDNDEVVAAQAASAASTPCPSPPKKSRTSIRDSDTKSNGNKTSRKNITFNLKDDIEEAITKQTEVCRTAASSLSPRAAEIQHSILSILSRLKTLSSSRNMLLLDN